MEKIMNGKYMEIDGIHWYKNGLRHREDGPAVEESDGSKHWYKDGQYHREDGPAYEGSNGSKEWYINGFRHRKDGPAVEWSDGSKYWFLNGVQYTEEEFNIYLENKKLNEFLQSDLAEKEQEQKAKL